jgi:hypothetical protein
VDLGFVALLAASSALLVYEAATKVHP